jgi:hypothetical protein
LGRDNVTRKGPRLVKVVLPASHFQRQVFSALKTQRHNLRQIDGFQRALVRPSLSTEQLVEDRRLREDLKKKRAENPGLKMWIRNGQIHVDGGENSSNLNS